MSQISFKDQESCKKKGKQLNYIDSHPKMEKILNKDYEFKQDIFYPNFKIEHLNQISKLKFYNNLNQESILNTFNYMFFKIRLGIFVEIKDNKLLNFVPFVNSSYKNEWFNTIKFPKNIKNKYEYEKYRSKILNRYEKLEDIEKWSSNNCLIGNWKNVDNKVGDMGWNELYEMLDELCKQKKINDITFFINRRDHPSITRNLEEPYFHIWDSMNKSLVSHKYTSYAPILSYCSSPHFADIMLPTYACWRDVTKSYYPTSCTDVNKGELVTDWNKKKPTAVFRGTSSGCGITPETNQRLKIAELSHRWSQNNNYNQNNPIDKIPYLDAGVVGWNRRDKKFINKPIDIINTKKFNFKKSDYISMHDQTEFKYIIHIDGHVAAYRLSKELSFGSVILKVDSLYDYKLWFTEWLKPWIHYIPIKKDLSDLADMITWCKKNDAKCRSIADNAKLFYQKYINKDFMLEYMENCLNKLSFNYINSETIKKIPENLKEIYKIDIKEKIKLTDSEINKYYQDYQNYKNILESNKEILNLFSNECDSKKIFFQELLKNIKKNIKNATVITNLKNDSILTDNISIINAIVERFGNKNIINLYQIPNLENHIVIKKTERKLIKNGNLDVINFNLLKNNSVDLLIFDYDNICSLCPLFNKEITYIPILKEMINYSIKNLENNGSLIIKIFDINIIETKDIITELSQYFENIFISKNQYQDQFNNVKYLIGLNFDKNKKHKKIENKDLININNIYLNYQIKNIKRNIYLINNFSENSIKNNLKQKKIC